MSERDGYAHLYLCELAGSCRTVTQGPWIVDGRVSFTGSGPDFVIDERSGFVYFSATEKDPRERHLYRIRLDGTGRTRLTRRTAPTAASWRPTAASTRTAGPT